MGQKTPSFFLVVEDNDDDFTLIARAFARGLSGFGVHREVDGFAAKEFLIGADQLPMAILSDFRMPQMDGLELLGWVRGRQATHEIPFFLWSSVGQADTAARARILGATTYSPKPSGIAEMAAAVSSIAALAIRAF